MPLHFWDAFAVFLQILLFLVAIYYLGIALFSLFPPREKSGKDQQYRFAIVIPAHNEASVLPGLLQSLIEQEYSKNDYQVFVIADRCTDNTETVAKNYGATVLHRQQDGLTGKGAALTDAFAQIDAIHHSFDAFIVIDADNIVDTRFLLEINHAMQQGNQAVQGYIDSKNPNDSWVSHSYSIWYWITNRILQMGFDRLGIGAKLGGTGFALSKTLLDKIPWKTNTIAEDTEYTTQLALASYKVAYAHKAIVYDEKPTSLRSSVPQRARWASGITEVQRDLCGKLFFAGKWNAFLRFWSDLLMPLTFFLFLLIDVFSVLHLCQIATFSFVSFWTIPLPFLLLNFYLLGMTFSTLYGLIQDKKCNGKLLLNLFGFLIYLASWIPAGVIGILNHSKKEWYHTKHKSGN